MDELKKRLWSLLWRVGWMAASMLLVFLTDNLDLISATFNIGVGASVVLGLILAEISKAVRNKLVQ